MFFGGVMAPKARRHASEKQSKWVSQRLIVDRPNLPATDLLGTPERGKQLLHRWKIGWIGLPEASPIRDRVASPVVVVSLPTMEPS